MIIYRITYASLPKFSSSNAQVKKTVTERTIIHFKDALGNPMTRNGSTIKADMLLGGIAQLITVILADKMSNPKLFRSLSPLMA